MKYCSKCGKDLMDDAAFCVRCGAPTAPITPAAQTPQPNLFTAPQAAPVADTGLLTKLAERLNTNGIIWIVIAVIQILAGISGFSWVLIVGVLNLISAITDINFSKTVVSDPRGIVPKFESVVGPIIALAYNLLVGGVIGVLGSIYYFVGLRSFVMENKNAFLALEASYNQQAVR